MTVEGLMTIALPAGRMLEEAADALNGAGYDCPYDKAGRKLIFEGRRSRYIISRPSDVPVYVARGAADLGIVGKDGLSESGEEVYELIDLGFGKCRFVLAAPVEKAAEYRRALEEEGRIGRLRIATKFPSITREFAKDRILRPEIIELKGAVELAASVGLADAIVDIVASGLTLKENGLEIVAEISKSSARLIASRSSYGLRAQEIAEFCGMMARPSSAEDVGEGAAR